MDTSSCNPKPPFVKLEDNGQASILNYNLPQQTAYNAVGYLDLTIDKTLFKEEQLRQTSSPTWDRLDQVKELNTEGVKLAIANDNNLIKDHFILRNNIHQLKIGVEKATQLTLSEKIKATLSTNARRATEDTKRSADLSTALVGDEINITSLLQEKYIDYELVAQKINKGYLPVAVERFSRKPEVVFVPRPKEANPKISLQLNFKMLSFLGDYGAGQTIKTLHLLPGERSTITMRTYKSNEIVKEQAQNVLDSFSESSADALQDTVERQIASAHGYEKEGAWSFSRGWNAGGSLGLDIGVFSLGIGGGVNQETGASSSFTTAAQSMVNNLVSSVDYHVASSDTLRQIEINSETTTHNITETEESIVRQIENINHSRVLNFVFRQLLQEYISITYLDSVNIVYYNGFPESRRVAKLADMDILLKSVLKDDAAVLQVQNKIYKVLCNFKDYQDTPVGFIEKVTENYSNCINPTDPADTVSYIRKKLDLQQTAEGHTVPGIIMNVSKRVLRTDSAVVDAVLGQGEALDCYNQNLQQSAVKATELSNTRMEQMTTIEQQQWEQQQAQWEQQQAQLQQAINIIDGLADPKEKVLLYKKVFGDCCDVPQSGGCGCGETKTHNPE